MYNALKEDVEKFLQSNNVNIHNPNTNYKSSDEYKRIKDTIINIDNACFIPIEEFIEHYLLSDLEVMQTYDSIYDMGNPDILTDDQSTDNAVAYEITLMDPSLANIDNSEKDEKVNSIENNLKRPGGLIDRLKSHLGINLESFDKKDMQYKRERCKILYLFYKLEHTTFSHINILKLLSNPSMENIDMSSVGIHTCYGDIVKTIKDSLEKELAPSKREKIKNTIYNIVSTWQNILKNVQKLMDFFYAENIKCNFENAIQALSVDTKDCEPQSASYSTLSPIEMLYLKIIQLEYTGNEKDICNVNKIEKNSMHSISPALIVEMKQLYHTHADMQNIEQYIYKHALRLSKYVYLSTTVQKEGAKKIRNARGKFSIWLDFCTRTNPSLDIATISNDLQIVSFLQAILLDDSVEKFDYSFYGYQKYFKHMRQVQSALKNENYVPNALQVYWIRKVIDRWYANLGRYDERIILRKFETAIDTILIEILKQPCLDEMIKMYNYYMDKVDEAFLTTADQIHTVRRLKDYLHSLSYEYIDPCYKIHYAFLYPREIAYTYEYLIRKIKAAIENHYPLIKERLTISTANGKGEVVLDLDIAFDHHNKQCVLQNFEIVSLE